MTKFVLILILLLCAGLNTSANYDPENKYHTCFDRIYNGFRTDDIEQLRTCMELFANDSEHEGAEHFALSEVAYQWYRTASAMRLFYLDLIKGDDERAAMWLNFAVSAYDNDSGYFLSGLSYREKKVTLIGKWLNWEAYYESNINSKTVGLFYENHLRND